MLSIQMLAGTKDQEINPAHNKSQHPQESPGHCTSIHLPALDLTDLQQAKVLLLLFLWCSYCRILEFCVWGQNAGALCCQR